MTTIGILPRSFGTHNGAFHADEVTACALLLHFGYIDRDKIVRTRDMGRLDTCDFVCDVGGEYDPKSRRFDHHQIDYQGDLSSAGMVLLYLKDQKAIKEELYEYLNRVFIRGIDDIDNGRWEPLYGHSTFSIVIANFVPVMPDASDQEFEDAFNEALDFVLGHLSRLTHKFDYLEKCKAIVSQVMQTMDECLVFEKSLAWMEPFFALGGENHSAEFVIMPTGKHWKLRGIPPTYERRMEVRRPLPIEWAGLLEGELRKVTKIPGAIFCHKGRFVSVWETKEDALKALKQVLGQK